MINQNNTKSGNQENQDPIKVQTMKEGYKNTEVGVIPEDWEMTNITDVITKNGGMKIGPFGSQLKKEFLVKEGYKVYGQENVYEKNFEIGNRYINDEHFQKLKTCELTSGDFIISMMGTIGKCMVVPKFIERGIMDSHLLRLRLNDKKVNADLLIHFFLSEFLINQVKTLSVGGIMDGLSSTIVKKITFPLPPTKAEQTAIATALSDADALINSLEKLIAKKSNIKQGAMQQLLKPKEGWEVKKLGESANIFRGGSPRPIENFITTQPNGINWIKIGDVGKGAKFIETTEEKIIQEGVSRSRFVNEGDFLLSNSMSFGRPYILKTKGCIHDGWLVIQNYQNHFDIEFLYYVLGSELILAQYKAMASGSSVLNLNKEIVKNVLINCPTSIEEQTRIATILSDIDVEIQALETKLEKYRKIKLGMMQNLLTGKIRLI